MPEHTLRNKPSLPATPDSSKPRKSNFFLTMSTTYFAIIVMSRFGAVAGARTSGALAEHRPRGLSLTVSHSTIFATIARPNA